MIAGVVLQMITDALPASVTVYDGHVPTEPPDRYAVVYVDPGTRQSLAVCGKSDSVLVRWHVVSVAPDGQRARWIAGRIADATLDQRPVDPEWSCGLIKHRFSEPPARNEAVMERAQIQQIDLYKVLATRK